MAPTWAIIVVVIVVIIIRRAREWIYLGQSSLQPRYEVDPPASLRRLNDNVYEVCNPDGRPTVELVFFHGLQREDNMDRAHLSTWSSRGKNPELWLQWLADEIVGVRILTVSYDAALKKTDTQGMMDSFLTSENLVQNLVHPEYGVGQDGCPVVLVGHSLGCLVIKEVLLKANSEDGKRIQGAENFLDNVRGIFSYSGPHKGANLPQYSRGGPFLDYLALLNKDVSRRNQQFEALRQKYGWTIAGVTEGYPTRLGILSFKRFIVPEGSARYDANVSFYTIPADHFDVCRPIDRTCSGFQNLKKCIEMVLQEDRPRKAPKKSRLKFPLGLKTVIDSMKDVLNHEKRLAIVGMGGIGKSTVAKALFDTIGNKFDYTCFVDDVKGKMQNDRSENYLRQMITEDLMYKGRKVDKNRFDWSMLESKRVLIILDDVDKKEHVVILNGEDPFLKQSCLVTTSRDRHQFLVQHEFEFHQMGTLDSFEAEKLLCWHALKQDVAPPNIQKWVKILAEKCGNLPLALEVVGGHLFKRADNEKLWEGTYKKLKEAKSVDGDREDTLWSILEWSFDALCSDERDMFLDIATVFHGEKLMKADVIWEAYLPSRESTWQNLVDKCLVSLKPHYGLTFISMHELYRDLGRRKANPDPADVTTHTRVYKKDKFRELLEKEEDGAAVKVLCYSSRWKFPSKPRWDMRRWKHLRVVWDSEDLAIYLYGLGSGVDADMIFPPWLQCTRINIVGYDTVERFRGVKALRCLILHTAWAIRWLPGSLCQLTELKHLEINNTIHHRQQIHPPSPLLPLREAPESFSLSALRQLEILKIEECNYLEELPDSLGQLCSLSKLSILRCRLLTKLPESLGQLSALSLLCISTCEKLTELPESLGKLRTLKELRIIYLELEKLPESVGQLRNLEQLIIVYCRQLKGVPESVGQLQSLKRLTVKRSIDRGSDLSASLGRFYIESLEELEITRGNISNLGFIHHAPLLQHLKLCAMLPEQLPISVGEAGSAVVKRLTLNFCRQSEIAVLPDSLEYLKVEYCNRLEKLPDSLGQLSRLRKVVIKHCDKLEDWRPSAAHVGSNLQELELECYHIPPVIFLRQDLFKLATDGRSLREGALQKGR